MGESHIVYFTALLLTFLLVGMDCTAIRCQTVHFLLIQTTPTSISNATPPTVAVLLDAGDEHYTLLPLVHRPLFHKFTVVTHLVFLRIHLTRVSAARDDSLWINVESHAIRDYRPSPVSLFIAINVP